MVVETVDAAAPDIGRCDDQRHDVRPAVAFIPHHEKRAVVTPRRGLLLIGGGDAALAVVQALADAFAAKHPGMKFTYDTSLGSDGGLNLAAQQVIDLGMASRELTAAENEIVDRVLVGVAGTGLVVHQTNTLKDLSTAQVESIYSGKVSDWSALGLSKSLPVIPLVREKGSSARATFENYV